jgi:hypothetical protein
MRWMEGINYTYNEIYDAIWKYNGGNNYNVSNEGYTSSSYKLILTDGCNCDISGHGEVAMLAGTAHMAGKDEP